MRRDMIPSEAGQEVPPEGAQARLYIPNFASGKIADAARRGSAPTPAPSAARERDDMRDDEIHPPASQAFFCGAWGRPLPAGATAEEVEAWRAGRQAEAAGRRAERDRALLRRRRAGYEPRH